ncbi:crocetin glucosyltransferase, chloroplastic-like [Malania oleifera]|uniref:crocetin glucosyltransferase, chloroplastic-like n=1 Tax=Malania oleifera TaxID=397392 RepID=UPI0025AE793F|nr:crocetin glucosyltransferase, chloroplastic-like [Malania oleifera]
MAHRHVVLVTFPTQGHINPVLQLAKRLLRTGVKVTLAAAVSAQRRMNKAIVPEGLTLATFSDGYDDGLKPTDDANLYLAEIKRRGSNTLTALIESSATRGHPITCLVYTPLLSWVAAVAREVHIPSALFWIQPATVLDVYYYYFHGYEDVIKNNSIDPSCSVKLPHLPSLTSRDLPSFLVPSANNVYAFLEAFQEQIEALDAETSPKVLVNSFDQLEPDAFRAVQSLNLVPIGPLIPSAFLDGKDPSDRSFGCELFTSSSEQYTEWLNSKPEASVIYVSFGSISVLSKQQMEEIARALLDTQRPFLWVIRASANEELEREEDDNKLSCREELEGAGIVVAWCSQVEVLAHPAVGCFMTHCGWNSTLESLVSGVPVVAFPQWTEQGTNAKLIEDVWKTGVRVRVNGEGVVESDEMKMCLETVMDGGERGEEIRRNAKGWRELAREAVKQGGSSDKNLKAFVNEIGECC